jgi:hypothetical protein
MNKKSFIYPVVRLAVIILLAVLASMEINRLRQENQILSARVAELEHSSQHSSSAQEKPDTSTFAAERAEKLELMRLRNEVTQLRATSQALAKLEAENARLLAENQNLRGGNQTPLATSFSAGIPRDQWSFQGYGTPEAAFLSGMWAMKEGQLETVLQTFTPEERQRFQQQNQGKSDAEIAARFQKEFGRVSGLRVLAQHQAAPGEVVLDVYLEGVGGMKKFRMNQVGNEWKAGGPISQNAGATPENDPLAFYRKNPELMKRYFPHLLKEGEPLPQQETPAAQAITDRYGLRPAAE